jgi:hypothetical protein
MAPDHFVTGDKGVPVSQLSLFSADLTPPQLDDLGGLLAAHGQLGAGAGGEGVRLSILLADQWRADALQRECRVRDVPALVVDSDGPGQVPETDQAAIAQRPPAVLLRTERTRLLGALAADWTRGAMKSAPPDLTVTAGFLRCWTIAAGRPAVIGFLLGLDPRAPDTHEPLAAACAAAGLAGSLLGIRGGGPAVRIVGYRRCSRLAEMIGTPPPEAPAGAFPALGH